MNNKKDSLGDRMKNFYENRAKTSLIRRMPCIIRLDGCTFHTFTKGFDKPFDEVLTTTMQEVTLELCKRIQGCAFGYTQSDEITLILVDYENIDSSAWFDYEVEKLCSVSASMATLLFNKIFKKQVQNFIQNNTKGISDPSIENGKPYNLLKRYNKAIEMGALFDARCFNVPINDVCNMVFWRELDCERNSIQGLGQAHFTPKELHQKSTSKIQDMLMEKCNINWNNLPTHLKRGTSVVKDENGKWFIDTEMPILKGEDRKYVESRIIFDN